MYTNAKDNFSILVYSGSPRVTLLKKCMGCSVEVAERTEPMAISDTIRYTPTTSSTFGLVNIGGR